MIEVLNSETGLSGVINTCAMCKHPHIRFKLISNMPVWHCTKCHRIATFSDQQNCLHKHKMARLNYFDQIGLFCNDCFHYLSYNVSTVELVWIYITNPHLLFYKLCGYVRKLSS